jgi:hypothetical protein
LQQDVMRHEQEPILCRVYWISSIDLTGFQLPLARCIGPTGSIDLTLE